MTSTQPIGVEVRHNSDLDPDPAYLAGFLRAKAVLRDAALLNAFQPLDRLANASQRKLRTWGTTSLILGTAALVVLTWKLFLAAIGAHMPVAVTWVAELGVLASIVLALLTKRRTRWLNARFMTETMRQWHFQSWLDGAYVSLAARDPAAFERERERRFGAVRQLAHGAEGARDTFVDAEDLSLWHELVPYGDSAAAAEVLSAYSDLRFGWQKSYFRLNREKFAHFDELTESLSRWSIFTAVVLAAIVITLLVCEASGREIPTATPLWLAATAITLAITSAAIRVYRSALGLSEQRERYEMKWTRLVTLEKAVEAAMGPTEKQEVMREVEIVVIEELREFLRVARKSSFLL